VTTKAGIKKEYRTRFLLDEAKLRKIASVMAGHAAKLSENSQIVFRAECEHDAYYETSDIDEVLNDDNAPGRAIERLTIQLCPTAIETGSGTPRDERAIAEVTLCRRGHCICLTITQDSRDWCVLLADDLDTQIKRLAVGRLLRYDPERIDSAISYGAMLLGIAVLVAGTVADFRQPAFQADAMNAMTLDAKVTWLVLYHDTQTTLTGKWLPWVIVGVLVGIAWNVLEPIAHATKWLSRSVFYWGDMVSAHDHLVRRMTQIKWGIVIGFIVSLVAGLVVAKLT